MKNSSARTGTLQFSERDNEEIARLKTVAEEDIVYEGKKPSEGHFAVVCGIEIAWILKVDREEETGQYQLLIKGTDGEPGLDVVQAMAAVFFRNDAYEIMPEPKSLSTVRVSSLFFPYSG
jgi:hypothetical protein